VSTKENEAITKEEQDSFKEYSDALAYVKDVISPAFMRTYPDKIRINNTYAKTYFIYAYPNYLEGNWLSPIINWDTKYDISLFVYPIDSAKIQKYLRKRLTELNSERSMNADKGIINDPAVDAQIQDVEELRHNLTRGQEKYFHLSIYITVYSDTVEKLDRIGSDIETILSGRNVLQKQSYLRAEQ
jgi:hypothetical protein